MASLDVLIAGAGPVGLFLAVNLKRCGLSVRIIVLTEFSETAYTDQTSDLHINGRCDVLAPRSMEMMLQLGIADRFFADAILTNEFCTYQDGELMARHATFYSDSIFNHWTNIPQFKIERILTKYLAELGVTVDRPTMLKSFDIQENEVQSIVVNDGKEEVVVSKYLIGCDGGKSLVRKSLGIPFVGKNAPIAMYVNDVTLKHTNIPTLHCFNSFKNEHGSIFTLQSGPNYYRFAINFNLERAGATYAFEDTEAVTKAIQKIVHPFEVEIDEYKWRTYYEVKELVADEYSDKKRRVFLAGDACHVQSPGGGVGMNLGLADAQNLAWKLALVIKGAAGPSLLETYQQERRDVAKAIVQISGEIIRLLSSENANNDTPEAKSVLANQTRETWARNSKYTSGVGYVYEPNHIIIRETTTTSAFSPDLGNLRVGQRAPNFALCRQGDEKVTDLFSTTPASVMFTILAFPGSLEQNKSLLQEFLSHATYFVNKYTLPSEELFRFNIILPAEKSDLEIRQPTFTDVKGEGIQKYGVGDKGAIIILRPDGFIGCMVYLEDYIHLNDYFDAVFKGKKIAV